MDGRKAYAILRYGGQCFPVCSPKCKKAFKLAPDLYLGKEYPTNEDFKLVLAASTL